LRFRDRPDSRNRRRPILIRERQAVSNRLWLAIVAESKQADA
jgi:hypothetical protein